MAKQSRKTKQREVIEEELRKIQTFFTTDELFNNVKRRDGSIGIATIYRYLGNKGKKDEIHSYTCGRRKIYSVGKDNHCHFICSRCGRITHFNMAGIENIKKSVKGEICHFQLDVYGICENCKQKGRV
jgi:Fur family ferric uptake transcriptional regulator